MSRALPALEDIHAQIIEVARTELRLDGPVPEGDLSAQLDSVQRLTLVVAIEDHFEIAFSPEDDASVTTLADVAACVRRHLAEERDRVEP